MNTKNSFIEQNRLIELHEKGFMTIIITSLSTLSSFDEEDMQVKFLESFSRGYK